MADEENEKKPQPAVEEYKKGWVVSALPPAPGDAFGGAPTALFEIDRQHPGGQAFVAGERPVEVAYTPGVVAALRGERLRELEAKEAKSLIEKLDKERDGRRAKALEAERAANPLFAPIAGAIAGETLKTASVSRTAFEDMNRNALERFAREMSVKVDPKMSDAELIAALRKREDVLAK